MQASETPILIPFPVSVTILLKASELIDVSWFSLRIDEPNDSDVKYYIMKYLTAYLAYHGCFPYEAVSMQHFHIYNGSNT